MYQLVSLYPLLLNFGLTVSLDRIVSDPAQHGEFSIRSQLEPLAHPGKEMGQGIVPSLNSLWDTG